MKYYKEMIQKGCFSRAFVVQLTGGKAAAASLIFDYLKSGIIQRVRRNLYVAVDLATGFPGANRYTVACSIAQDAYITHHSALEYHGCYNQVGYFVNVATGLRFKDFDFDGNRFLHTVPKIQSGVVDNGKVRVTDCERSVLDCLNELKFSGGTEEIIKSIDLLPSLDEEVLLKYLEEFNKIILYQKAGFILKHFQLNFRLSEEFFRQCQSKLTGAKRYFSNDLKNYKYRYNATWQLCVPDIDKIFSQGAENGYDI